MEALQTLSQLARSTFTIEMEHSRFFHGEMTQKIEIDDLWDRKKVLCNLDGISNSGALCSW